MSDPHIVMVLLGESGSGKSTLINYLTSYFSNASFDSVNHYSNVKVVIPNRIFPQPNYGSDTKGHNERNIYDNTMSQTQDCSDYDYIHNGQRIKIIDTPGFNDTDSKKDDANIQKILKRLGNYAFITAILITINGTNTRLSTSIKTTLSQLRGSLPDKVFQNLFFIFTNCTEETRNFDVKLIAEFNPSTQRTFHMQNSLFSIKDMSLLKNDRLVQKMVQTWKESFDTIHDIMCAISQTTATTAQVFEDMRIRRERLVAHKENLIEKQKSLLKVLKVLAIEKDRLENATNDRETNKNFNEQRTINVIEIEMKPYYSTICMQHGKVQVCHEKCSLSYEPELNLAHFQHCLAADKMNCRHCKCGMNEHLHSYEIPVTKMKTINEIIQSKKAAFDQATTAMKNISNQMDSLDCAQHQCQNEVNDIKNGLVITIRELKQICTHFNFAEEMAATIQKLRQEAKIENDLHAKQEFNDTADTIEQLLKQISSW